jgi:PAS domain S-box-containing protein
MSDILQEHTDSQEHAPQKPKAGISRAGRRRHRDQVGSALHPREDFIAGQKRILEMVATGAPLIATLDELLVLTESQEPGMICGLLLTDDNGATFQPGSGPSIPQGYRSAVHEAIKTIPNAPPYFATCAESAHRCAFTEVPDVARDNRYAQPWRDLMLASGLRAIRSTPVVGSSGRVLGCLALYFDRARDPNPADPQLIDIVTHLASIAIERHRTDQAAAAELADAKLLQSLSIQLIGEKDDAAIYDSMLDAAVAIMRSDFGSMQVLHPERGANGELQLLTSRAFTPQAQALWQWVKPDSGTSCGEALRTGARVIVDDINTSPLTAGKEVQRDYLENGIQAMQTTPLVSRTGKTLGMISTHWRKPHQPEERQLRLLDVLARQAADLVERFAAEAALRDRESTLRAFYDNTPVYMGVVEPTPDGDIRHIYDNPLSCELLGLEAGGTAGLLAHADLKVHPESLAKWLERYKEVEATQGPVRFEHRIKTGGSPRWLSTTVARIGAAPSGAARFCYVSEEVTERKAAEERQKLLTNELNHRVKNTLAIIQSIATQTLRETPEPAAFASSFTARLMALSRAHNLLTHDGWRGADLRDIVTSAMAPFQTDGGEQRVLLNGPSIMLDGNAAVTLSMALHELATNATKYGALSVRSGRVELAWTRRPGNRSGEATHFGLDWVERGGPPVVPPRRQGFGHRVIEASAEQLDGEVVLDFPADGATCRMILPLPRLDAEGAS